jgi:hypothetical protein
MLPRSPKAGYDSITLKKEEQKKEAGTDVILLNRQGNLGDLGNSRSLRLLCCWRINDKPDRVSLR